MPVSRNQPLGFAANTKRNMQHIRAARLDGAPVHEVTQIANSLLGLIVVPFEKGVVPPSLKKVPLELLSKSGWPSWHFELEISETLGSLIHHLRNAVSHGRMIFSSDNAEPSKVEITVEDWKRNATAPYWKARINGAELQKFCEAFITLLRQDHLDLSSSSRTLHT
jgi:hypothetical protein